MSFINGSAIKVTYNQTHKAYLVDQKFIDSGLPKPLRGQTRLELTKENGPTKTTGYVDLETLDVGIVVLVAGIQIGPFYSNLANGQKLVIVVNLLAVTGEISYYVRDNKIFSYISLKTNFDDIKDGYSQTITLG